MGWNASDTRPLTLHRRGGPGGEPARARAAQGFKQFLHILDIGRIGVAAMGVGLAQGALDEALKYAKERQAFGQSISKFQSIQAKLADMATEIEAARLLTYKAAWEKDQGRNFTLTAAQAKLKTGRLAVRCAEEAVQIHGGYGYIEEYPVCRYVPRREDPHHRRGHRRGPADGHRPRARSLRRARTLRPARSGPDPGGRPTGRLPERAGARSLTADKVRLIDAAGPDRPAAASSSPRSSAPTSIPQLADAREVLARGRHPRRASSARCSMPNERGLEAALELRRAPRRRQRLPLGQRDPQPSRTSTAVSSRVARRAAGDVIPGAVAARGCTARRS